MRPPRRIPPQSLDHGRRRLRRGHHRLPQLRGGPRPRNPCSVSFCLGRKASLSSLAATHIHDMVSIENLTTVQISSYEELRAIIMRGSEQRHIAGTNMNEESSRSHLIFLIIIESTNLQTQSLAKGKLSFVDLAGSERVKKSGSAGNQLKEAQSINKSLSALVDVISALSSDGQHIPYRNHKLTMLMSDSLGGNAKTLMFVNLSPAESNLDETYNSLMYASRVRCIVNDPSKNVSTKEVARLKKLVSYWKEQAGKRADEEELEEIQEERPAKEKSDGRLSM